MSTPTKCKLEEVREVLIRRGTTFNAFCKDHGFVRQAVVYGLTGKRKGLRARILAERFLEKVCETE